MIECIASTEVRRIEADGKESIVVLKISRPVFVSDIEWCCYATDPGTKRKRKISGNDSIQVLSIALNFMGRRMRELKEQGISWREPKTNDEFPIDVYFFLEDFLKSIPLRSEPVGAGQPDNHP